MKTFILILLSILNLYLGIISGVYFIDYVDNYTSQTLFLDAIHYANTVLWFISIIIQMFIMSFLVALMQGVNLLKI